MANTLHQTIVATTFQALQATPDEKYWIAKDADQSLNTSTVLVNDTQLAFALSNNTDIWWFKFMVGFNLAGAASGYKFAITGPTTPANVRYRTAVFNGVSPGALSAAVALGAFGTSVGVTLAQSGDHYAEIEGVVEGGGAGSVTLQFAQNVSDAAAITIKRGSILIAQRIK